MVEGTRGGSLIDDENGCGFPSLNIRLIMTGISVITPAGPFC